MLQLAHYVKTKVGLLVKNCLILITSSYPFFTDEPFLETEMPYLAKRFDKVITLAVALDGGIPQVNITPENVDSYNVAVTSKRVSRIKSLMKGVANVAFPSELLKEDKTIGNSPKRRFFFEYFCARAEREFALCKAALDKYDFSEYDSVTVYSYWFFVPALIASKICDMLSPKCKKIKFVSRGHGYDVYEYANSVGYIPLREYLLSKVDTLYPCSIDGEHHIAAQCPKYKDKIRHSYLGSVDCGVSPMSENGFHIVSCSRMVDLKRIDRIANVLSLLKDEPVGKLKWTHIGDGETMQKVKAICDEKLSFMQVDLIGRIANTQVKEFYKTNKTDLLINVSSTEGLPVSMMEAQSFGIPVIATNVGGVGEIVKNEYNGWLISPEFTDEEVAAKMKEIILLDKEKLAEMRKNAREFWEKNFDAEKNYTEFADEIVCD